MLRIARSRLSNIRHASVWMPLLLVFGLVLALMQSGVMQTRMAYAHLLAKADICVASQHGEPRGNDESGLMHESGEHCLACTPAIDSPLVHAQPAYALWAEALSHLRADVSTPAAGRFSPPRPPGHAPPSSAV